MSYTTVPTVSTGDTWTAANHNTYIRDNFTDVVTFKGVGLIRSTNQSIPDTTLTAISYDTEAHDTDAFHAGGSPTRITIPAGLGGYYHVYAGIVWANATTTSKYYLYVRKNGATYLAHLEEAGALVPVSQFIGVTANLSATDYVEFMVYNQSGSARNLVAANAGIFAGAYMVRS